MVFLIKRLDLLHLKKKKNYKKKHKEIFCFEFLKLELANSHFYIWNFFPRRYMQDINSSRIFRMINLINKSVPKSRFRFTFFFFLLLTLVRVKIICF